MIEWTSFLWKINIHLAKKWPEMTVKWPFYESVLYRNRVYLYAQKYSRLLYFCICGWGFFGCLIADDSWFFCCCFCQTYYKHPNSLFLLLLGLNKHSRTKVQYFYSFKPCMIPFTRFLKCFVLITLCCKTNIWEASYEPFYKALNK